MRRTVVIIRRFGPIQSVESWEPTGVVRQVDPEATGAVRQVTPEATGDCACRLRESVGAVRQLTPIPTFHGLRMYNATITKSKGYYTCFVKEMLFWDCMGLAIIKNIPKKDQIKFKANKICPPNYLFIVTYMICLLYTSPSPRD